MADEPNQVWRRLRTERERMIISAGARAPVGRRTPAWGYLTEPAIMPWTK